MVRTGLKKIKDEIKSGIYGIYTMPLSCDQLCAGRKPGGDSHRNREGRFMAYNFPHSHFTVRVEGENVTPAKRPYVFFVDNRALQLVTVDLRDVNSFSSCKNQTDSLRAHQKYELKYLEGILSQPLTLSGDEILAKDGKTFLFWHFDTPPEMNVQLGLHVYVTMIIGDKLLMLNTAGTKVEQLDELKRWITKFAFTVEVYPHTINIAKLMNEIKNE